MVNIRASDAKYMSFGGIYSKAVEVKPEDRFRFDCLRCGWCCQFPPRVNPKEASRIANYLGLSKKDFFSRYVTLQEDNSYYGWRAKIDKIGDNCAFYSKEKGKASCKIHPVKPRQCKVKPILRFGNNFSEKSDIEAMHLFFEPCRGFGRGREYSVREWIEMNNLEEDWQEEVEYYIKLGVIEITTPDSQLKNKIEEMFTK